MDRVQQPVQPKVVAVTLEGWLQLPHTPWFAELPLKGATGLGLHQKTAGELISGGLWRGDRWQRGQAQGGSHA